MTRSLARFLFRRFRKLETDVHPLTYLFWECTTRCNLSCLHCGSDCSMNSHLPDMPLSDFLGAIDTIKRNGMITVVLTGGEPLLRRDLEECGRQIRKRGMRWGIVSNGYLYNEERHNALLSAGMGALTISLDGLEASHNWLRNTAGSFDRAVHAITLAASSPRLNFDVVTCVNPRNIGELDEMYNFLLSAKVKAWRLFTIAPIGRAESNRELLLSGDSFRQLMDFIAEKRTLKQIDIKFSCESSTGPYETRVRDGYFFCRAGINIGSVLADGSISACPNIDRSFVQGNIYRDNFFEVWQHRYSDFRNREWARRGKCAHCKEFKDCLGNGMHLWHGAMENVLVCHNNTLQRTEK